MREAIKELVVSIIADVLNISTGDDLYTLLDNEETHINKDLGGDSLHQVEFIMALEKATDIEISDQDAEKIMTIGAAIDYLQKRRVLPNE